MQVIITNKFDWRMLTNVNFTKSDPVHKSITAPTSKWRSVGSFCWPSVRLVLSLDTHEFFPIVLFKMSLYWSHFYPFVDTLLSQLCHLISPSASVSLLLLLFIWQRTLLTLPIRRHCRSSLFLVYLDRSRFVLSKDTHFAIRTLILG